MSQEKAEKDEIMIFIPGYIRSDKQDFFSKLNSFSFILVRNKEGRVIFNIPLWTVAVAMLVAIFALRTIRSR